MSTPPISNFRRMIRQTLTIARRDFVATVFTPTFLIFLFTPVIMLSFGAIGGFGAVDRVGLFQCHSLAQRARRDQVGAVVDHHLDGVVGGERAVFDAVDAEQLQAEQVAAGMRQCTPRARQR